MSIKIHWGAPGSFKTSGAVTDDFIPAVKAGRTIVTNVRGLDNEQHVRQVLNIPDENTFKLIYLDTEGADAAINAEKICRFFHWMPHGAFLLLDEAPKFWVKAWNVTKLKEFDFIEPDGTVGRIGCRGVDGEERPHNFLSAFQQHRHYGWDMVLTSTNITNFRHDIRANSEGAYKHRNMALVGIKGRYNEGFHSAESAGKQSDFLSLRNKKIPKVTWSLYSSTATGTFTDTIAGSSIFADPKIFMLLFAVVGLLVFLSTRSAPTVLGGSKSKDSVPAVSPVVPSALPAPAVAVVSSQKATSSSFNVGSSDSVVVDDFKSGSQLKGYVLKIVGSFGKVGQENFLFKASNGKETFELKKSDLIAYGYKADVLSSCLVIATSLDGSVKIPITCKNRLPALAKAETTY